MKRIKQSVYVRNVLTLMSGTIIAQLIPILLSPILSRLFTPDDFSVLAVYMSVVSIISTVVTLKYELAIILPEKDVDSFNTTILSLIISVIISFIAAIVLFFFGTPISNLFSDNNEQVAFWLKFAPVSILFIGIYNSLGYWINRKAQYKSLALSKIVQSSGMTGLQIGTALIKKGPLGLLTGEIAGRVLSAIVLGSVVWRDDRRLFSSVSKQGILTQIKRYQSFPKFSIPADLINVVTNQIPVFVIGRFFGSTIMGSYAFMDRILAIPIALLGKSILDVFKQRASSDYYNTGNCKKIFLDTYKVLLIMSVIPTLLLLFVAPWLFAFIFGPDWKLAGEFAQILAILFFFKFTISPLSYVIYIAEKQKYDLIWQSVLFVVTSLSFYLGVFLNNVKICLLIFSISYSLMYIIYFFMSYKFALGNKPKSTI